MKNFIRKKLFIVAVVMIVNIVYCVNYAFADSYDGPSPNGEPAYIDAKDGYANIRKGAGTKYDVIAKLDNGVGVRVFGSIKNKKGEKWYCIAVEPDCGWTHESNIKIGEKKK